MSDEIKKLGQDVEKAAEDTAEEAKKLAGKVAEQSQKAAEKVAETGRKAAEKLAEKEQKASEKVAEKAEKAFETVTAEGKKAAARSKEKLDDVSEEVKESASDMASSAGENLQAAAEKIADKVHDVSAEAGEKLSKLAGKAKDKVQEAAEEVGQKLKDVQETANDEGEEISEEIKEPLTGPEDEKSHVMSQVGGFFSSLFGLKKDAPKEEEGTDLKEENFMTENNEKILDDEVQQNLDENFENLQGRDIAVDLSQHEKAIALSEDGRILTAANANAESQLSFNEQVIEKIATIALRDVEGVLAATGSGGFFNLKNSKGVEIQIQEDESVVVNLEVILEYGRSAPEVFKQLKEKIGSSIRDMTGLSVQAINVRVINVLTPEEFNGKQ